MSNKQIDDNKWTKLEPPPSPRCAHISVLTQTRHIDVFGGWDGMGTIFNDSISYDTEDNTWITIETLEEKESVPRFAHCACILSNEKILVTGGVNASSDLSDLIIIRRMDE